MARTFLGQLVEDFRRAFGPSAPSPYERMSMILNGCTHSKEEAKERLSEVQGELASWGFDGELVARMTDRDVAGIRRDVWWVRVVERPIRAATCEGQILSVPSMPPSIIVLNEAIKLIPDDGICPSSTCPKKRAGYWWREAEELDRDWDETGPQASIDAGWVSSYKGPPLTHHGCLIDEALRNLRVERPGALRTLAMCRLDCRRDQFASTVTSLLVSECAYEDMLQRVLFTDIPSAVTA